MKLWSVLFLALMFAASAAFGEAKIQKKIWGTNLQFKKVQKTRSPASLTEDLDVLRSFTHPAYLAFVKNAQKLKFSEQGKMSAGENAHLSPAEYFKKMLFDSEGSSLAEERFPSASCEPLKKGARACKLSIFYLLHEKSSDVPSGVETFESSIVLKFSIDAKGNVIGNSVDLYQAG